MKRSELEVLDISTLQQLIVDATDVLAAKAKSAGTKIFAPPDRAPAAQSSGSLFTFGAPAGSTTAPGPGTSAGLFSNAGSGGLFSSASTGGLFGGATGGLFSSPGSAASTGGLFSSASSGGLFGGASTGGASTGGLFGGDAAGKLFGGTGGGLFGGGTTISVTPAAPAAEGAADEEGDGEDDLVNEEEVTAVYGWTPSITLEVREDIANGEEGEEQIYDERSKLLRFRDGEWKERGLGEARLMKDKTSGRVRFLMRQEKTGKVVANHYVIKHETYCDLRPNAGSEKVWVWKAQDISDGEILVETFALKFKDGQLAGLFKEAFDAAKESNEQVMKAEATANSEG